VVIGEEGSSNFSELQAEVARGAQDRLAILDNLFEIVAVPQKMSGALICLLQEYRRGSDLLVSARIWGVYLGRKSAAHPKDAEVCYGRAQIICLSFTL